MTMPRLSAIFIVAAVGFLFMPASDASPLNSSAFTTGTSSPQHLTSCSRKMMNISVDPPRNCSTGYISVPVCSGACNSYAANRLNIPYVEKYGSCCQPTTYRVSKRTASFVCDGLLMKTVTFSVAIAIDCGCVTFRPILLI
ncbi:hypothetical protein EMCRGX_G025612 [Ephydatia muelleri]|eukprot:Em0021g414a